MYCPDQHVAAIKDAHQRNYRYSIHVDDCLAAISTIRNTLTMPWLIFCIKNIKQGTYSSFAQYLSNLYSAKPSKPNVGPASIRQPNDQYLTYICWKYMEQGYQNSSRSEVQPTNLQKTEIIS